MALNLFTFWEKIYAYPFCRMYFQKPMKAFKLSLWIFLGIACLALLLQQGQTTIENEVLIQKPRAQVFEYVSTPAYWPRWHPSSLGVTGTTDHSLEPGEKVREEFEVAGRKGSVEWTVVEKNAPSLWSIEGEIAGGRGSGGTITYRLEEVGGATRFVRTFSYHIPGFFYKIVNRLYYKGRVKKESRQAVEALKKVLEAS